MGWLEKESIPLQPWFRFHTIYIRNTLVNKSLYKTSNFWGRTREEDYFLMETELESQQNAVLSYWRITEYQKNKTDRWEYIMQSFTYLVNVPIHTVVYTQCIW